MVIPAQNESLHMVPTHGLHAPFVWHLIWTLAKPVLASKTNKAGTGWTYTNSPWFVSFGCQSTLCQGPYLVLAMAGNGLVPWFRRLKFRFEIGSSNWELTLVVIGSLRTTCRQLSLFLHIHLFHACFRKSGGYFARVILFLTRTQIQRNS